MDKERIRKLCKWADEYSDGYVGDIATDEIRALLDLATERDRYRALLERALPSVDWAELMGVINSRLRVDIRAALEGKTNE